MPVKSPAPSAGFFTLGPCNRYLFIGTFWSRGYWRGEPRRSRMHSIIYLVGLVVIVLAILSFLGLR